MVYSSRQKYKRSNQPGLLFIQYYTSYHRPICFRLSMERKKRDPLPLRLAGLLKLKTGHIFTVELESLATICPHYQFGLRY